MLPEKNSDTQGNKQSNVITLSSNLWHNAQYDQFIKTKINVKAVFGKNVEFSNKYFKLFLGEM